jgi:hypothetical protein
MPPWSLAGFNLLPGIRPNCMRAVPSYHFPLTTDTFAFYYYTFSLIFLGMGKHKGVPVSGSLIM